MNRKDMRAGNLNRVSEALRNVGHATKPQLAEITGLSVMTVNSLLNTMLENGEAEIMKGLTASPSDTGGRPARQYRYVADRSLVLCLCFYEADGINRLLVAVENLCGDVLCQDESVCSEIELEFFYDTVCRYRDRYPAISCIVIGIPGVEVDGKLSIIDYAALRGKRLRESISAFTGLPVVLINDVNAAVKGYGDFLGNTVRCETVIAIYWPLKYPPGAGILLNGELYQGRDGIAGEMGYAFSDKELVQESCPELQAAEAVLNFARYWNPHRMVFYHEGLSTENEKAIREMCKASIPERFLPEFVLGRALRHDYVRGIHVIAQEQLHLLL